MATAPLPTTVSSYFKPDGVVTVFDVTDFVVVVVLVVDIFGADTAAFGVAVIFGVAVTIVSAAPFASFAVAVFAVSVVVTVVLVVSPPPDAQDAHVAKTNAAAQ